MKFKSLFLFIVLTFIIVGCDNEDLDDALFLSPVNLIAKDTELFNLLEDVTEEDNEYTCIQFIYPFAVAIFNENNVEESQQTVAGDADFFLLLDNLEEGYSIGVSFPITSVLDDGTSFELNSLEELQEAIAACREEWQEAIVSQSNQIIQECVWEVAIPENLVYSTYIDAVFAAADDGGIIFYHRGIAYDGTWIIFFIEDELHLNINIDDQEEIGLDWNFDWKISSYSTSTIELFNDEEDAFVFNRECEEENYCTTLNFTECELEGQPGFAEFDLQTYNDCIIIMAAPQPIIDEVTGELPPPIDWELTYYELEEDAQLGVNPLNTVEPYLNVTPVQDLFVRIAHPENQSFTIVGMRIEAIFCE